MQRGSTRGRLLVALPALADPNFDRSVVYMVEHNDEGAFGIIVNRLTDDDGTGAIDPWTDRLARPAGLYEGGPVQRDGYIGLAEVDGTAGDGEWATLGDGLGTVDLTLDPALVGSHLGRLRIFRGYAGWGPRQLEGELDADAWLVVEADREDVFTTEPTELWRAVLRRQPGRTAWLANYPADLADN